MNPEIVQVTTEGVWVSKDGNISFMNFASLYPKCIIELNVDMNAVEDLNPEE